LELKRTQYCSISYLSIFLIYVYFLHICNKNEIQCNCLCIYADYIRLNILSKQIGNSRVKDILNFSHLGSYT